jgi:RimJ/RimL family protein N-acetyltransferase
MAGPMAVEPQFPIRTRRLLLRPLGEDDVDALVAYRSRPDVCRYVPFEPMDAATVRAKLTGSWSRRCLDAEGQAFVLGVVLAADATLVGDVMLAWTSELHQRGELGYVLDPRHGGHGYATEAAHAALHLAFDGLRLRRVIARVDAENLASARLLARLGMRQEAHLVENEWFKGRWSDELDWALLADEWRAGHAAGGGAACPMLTPISAPAAPSS